MVTTTITEPLDSNHDASLPVNKEKDISRGAQDLDTPLIQSGRWFKDDQGRTLLMRGVNLSGSSKLPNYPFIDPHHDYDEKLFWDHRNVSFVGRPFPLKDAPIHFARLRAWGLTLIRLLVPWEALEHAGPGIYDEDYIDYLRQLIGMMPYFGLKCFIDPHQDTWSRFSGGSGAPGWTFEVAGLDIKAFKETGAAIPGDPLTMVWPTNYTKLASCTMFTLFFAGDTFAPNHTYKGQSVQQFLSNCFINAFAHLGQQIKDLDAVIGFEVMNEPHYGYIGLDNLKAFNPIVNLIFGDSPSPLQCFALGDGIPQDVSVYVKSWPFPTRKSHSRMINQSKTSAWLPGQSCVWRQHGVWKADDRGEPVLLRSDYFSKHPVTGEAVDFYRDFYVPFVNRYVAAIQAIKTDWHCFVEPLPNEKAPLLTASDCHDRIVYAPHWYDLNCLFSKKFDGYMTHDVQSLQNGGNVLCATYFGKAGVRSNYRGQIRNIRNSGLNQMGEKPCVFGEVGIPMDLNHRVGLLTGDYKHHVAFMDAVLHALEANLAHFTLWNYDPYNDHEHGDHWNGENFSIYCNPVHSNENVDSATVSPSGLTPSSSPTTQSSLALFDTMYDGGRVLDAVVRPYAAKIAGEPLKSEFDIDTGYTLIFQPMAGKPVSSTTEIFVPFIHFKPEAMTVSATAGTWEYRPESQSLYHRYDPALLSQRNEPITIKIRCPSAQRSKCSIM